MSLFLGLVFGAVGGVYLFYGRREHDALYAVVGVALILFPYFISDLFLMCAVGVALAVIPIGRVRGWF